MVEVASEQLHSRPVEGNMVMVVAFSIKQHIYSNKHSCLELQTLCHRPQTVMCFRLVFVMKAINLPECQFGYHSR